jgi:hypothetical protein
MKGSMTALDGQARGANSLRPMRARLSRLFERARRLLPVRWGGVALIAVALLALTVSRDESDHLLEPVALIALALVLATVLLVTVSTLVVRHRLKAQAVGVPPELSTGAEFITGFRVPNVRLLGLLDVELEWIEPKGFEVELVRADGTLGERIRAVERGRHERLTRRVTIEDVFGLASLSFELSWELALRVAPVAAPVHLTLASSFSSGDSYSHPSGRPEGDLIEMRSYAHGDSIRHVLWRTFARTRRLLVRIPERAVAPQPVNVAFLLAGDGDEPSAGVARVFVEQGLLGPDFVFAADGASQPTTRVPEAVEQIIDSVRARRGNGPRVDDVSGLVQPHRLGACVVFAPPVDGPWRQRLVAMAQRLAVKATVIIGTDTTQATSAPDARSPSRWLLEDEGARQSEHLATLRQVLEADGFGVQLIHRPSGRHV